MRVRALVVLLAITSAGLLTVGCAGNASPPPPVSAPKIVTAPVSQTVAAGQSATFNVTATGAAPLSYQWQKNGTVLNGATSASYVTPPANSFDNGAQFNVVVSNTSGSLATTAATLTVNSPPAITAQPSSQTVTAGQSATFSVTATGSAPLSYQWNKNGASINGATAATYTTPVTTTTDSGAQFNVVASNSFGNVASNTATLTVNPLTIAPAITSANSLTLLVGTAGTFTVTATGAPTVSLAETGTLPGGVTFVDNGNGTGTLSGTPAVGSGKIYSITFTASNGVGTPASQSFALTVNEAPAFSSRNSATFNLGTSELFAVLTTGFPAPSLTETGALPSGVTFVDNHNGTATLAGTPAAGTGKTYSITFTASNGVGTPATQAFTLTVNQPPAITSPNSTTFNAGTSASFTVLTNGFPTPSVTETGALPSGVTFKDNGNGSATLSGTPASASAGTYSLTFTASNGVGTPASQTFALTVNPANAGPVITSVSSTTFTVGTAGTFSVTTTGTPTPSLAETGALPTGVTFRDNGNGTATLSGTPAAGSAGTYALTFTATNGVGTPPSQTFTLTVGAGSSGITCGTGHESVLNGQYAFFFQGFDANGPVAVAGTFSADGTGKVALVSGVEDIDTTIGAQTNVAINSAGSSYSVGADNRGCLTIATASGTSKYAISLGSLTANVSGRGRMIEVDSTGTLGSGELRLVTATTAISGGFNFGVSSTESVSSTTPNRFAMAGSFTASGGTITAGEPDFNLSGSVDGGAAGPLAITNGSYTVASNGRGTLTFDVSSAGTFNMAIYIISAKEFTLVNIGAPSVTNPPFGGAAHQQSGTFSTSSLTGNIVFYSSGLCVGCGPGSTAASDVSMGVMTVSTAGSFTLTGDENQAGTLTSLSDSGSYTVDASGRTVVQGGGGSSYILYLETTGRGFLLTTGSEVGMGFTDPQKGGPFTNASLSATLSFGTAGLTEENVIDSAGVETFNGLGAVSGTADSASLGAGSSSNAFNQTYSITNGTNGRGTITSGGATVSIFYMISTSHMVLMDANNPSGSANAHPAITISR